MDLYGNFPTRVYAKTPELYKYCERALSRLGIGLLGPGAEASGEAGEELEQPGLVIFEESGLVNGTELCRQWRSRNPQVLIVILAAQGQFGNPVAGLLAGADRYVTLPLPGEIFAAGLAAQLRRELGGWDRQNRGASEGLARLAALPPVERQILNHLANHRDRVCGYQELGLAVGRPGLKRASTVRAYVARLRARLGPEAGLLESVSRVGYRFGKVAWSVESTDSARL